VRQFLAEALTPAMRLAGRRTAGIFTDAPEARPWFRALAQRGWSAPHWPVEWGGCGWTPRQHDIFASECAAAGAPAHAPQGTRMVAPVLLAFGTEEQKQRWLPAIRDGSDYWCQGYSEPGSGSDLASLQCKAVRDGDHYIINGTKIWTTHAQWANRIFCLVRTSSTGKPQQGISFLLFDMDLPGITVRPIISISGDHELNQVFFDDVRVPASALLGEENQGWTIAKYLLVHERGGAYAPALRARLARLQAMAVPAFATRPADDAERQAAATALADAACRLDALQALEQQVLADRIAGVESPIAPSVGKLLGTELRQHLTELAVSIAGPYAAARLPIGEAGAHALALPEDALWAMGTYLNDRAASIYAGTNEVQRNLIAQHLLSAPPAMEAVLPLDDTQALLQSSLQRWLQNNAPFERRAALLATPGGFQPLWTGLAQQLGLLGAALPEAVGGQGGSLADHLVVLQALGQALLPEPYSACLVTGAGLLQRLPSPATQALLAGVADGAVRPVLAALEPGARHDLAQVATRLHADGTLSGRKALVRAAPQATHWLVSARDGAGILRLALVRPGAAGATQRDVRLSDGGWAAELAFDHTPCEALPEAPDGSGDVLPLLQQVADEALLATGAEAVGVMQRLLHETLDYVRQRKQFGVAIASFQVTQHRLADMHMALIQARALVAATLAAMDQPPAQRARAVAACQLQVARAARTVGQSAVQLHGGMGMTEELAVGHAFKRLTLIEHHQGGPAVHLQRVVRWQDAQPAPSTPA